MVNNLGGLSNLELFVFANDCVRLIAERRSDVHIRRLYAGTFMTSLNMSGVSVTALLLDGGARDASFFLQLLDAAVGAPAWPLTCGRDVGGTLECVKAQPQNGVIFVQHVFFLLDHFFFF